MQKLKDIILLGFVIITIFGFSNHENKTSKTYNPPQIQHSMKDPRVTGIGGIFFRSKDPKSLTEWYGTNLGLATDDYGSAFEFRNAIDPEKINYLRWSPFDEQTDYFDPSEKQFMINYRVQHIEGLVEKLKADGVKVVDEIQEYEYGKFVHLMDPEGNKIELWEPKDDFFTQMGGPTTK